MSSAGHSGSTGASTISQTELRRTFIAMLFALVAATIAQEMAELLFVVTGGWDVTSSPSGIWRSLTSNDGMLIASLSHAILALLLVSMSWVMWSKSQAAGHRTEISSVFSKEFLILLIEVFLVVLYFAIAKTMEQNFSEYSKIKSIAAYVGSTSGRPEALQMMWVFGVYFIWDVMVDVIYSPRDPHPVQLPKKFLAFFQGVFTYCSVSIFCISSAWLVSQAAPSIGTPYQAFLADIALIVLLLFFALGKQLEFYIAKISPGEETRKNTMRTVAPSKMYFLAISLLAFIYSFCLVVLKWFS